MIISAVCTGSSAMSVKYEHDLKTNVMKMKLVVIIQTKAAQEMQLKIQDGKK